MSKIPVFPNKFSILASLLGATGVHYEVSIEDQRLINLFNAIVLPTDGGMFSGGTSAGAEGAWFGYRNVSKDTANIILLYGYEAGNLHIGWAKYEESNWRLYNI